MKKSTLLFLSSISCLIVFQSFELGKRRNGTDPGYTGSPGDSLKTCKVCHGGEEEWQPNWITSDIPASGFEPGVTYTITATNTKPTYNRFGFQVSPQNKKGDLLGTLIVSDPMQTMLVGDGKYITYTSAGVDGEDAKSWTFKWKAPSDSINEVTFYGAFNSNHDGHKFSDRTTVSNLRVFKKGYTGLNQTEESTGKIKTSYLPSEKEILILLPLGATRFTQLEIIDLSGKTVYLANEADLNRAQTIRISAQAWQNGIYLIKGLAEGRAFMGKTLVY